MPEGELPTRLRRSDEFFMTHSRIGTLRTTPLRDHGPAGRYPLNSLMSRTGSGALSSSPTPMVPPSCRPGSRPANRAPTVTCSNSRRHTGPNWRRSMKEFPGRFAFREAGSYFSPKQNRCLSLRSSRRPSMQTGEAITPSSSANSLMSDRPSAPTFPLITMPSSRTQ